jgi:cysteine-rich repeat protein
MAAVSPQDQKCITAFNKSLRNVAKAQSGIIKKCLTEFAAGKLSNTTPEGCVRSDPNGKLSKAAQKAVNVINQQCGTLPAFGATATDPALLNTVLGEIDLVHGSFGNSLDSALIENPTDASCQASAGAALLKCEDRRVREFLKCQKLGLTSGAVTDAATLTANCLGVGGGSQPDPKGRIAADCGTAIDAVVTQRCGSTNLANAFAPCNPTDASDATSCLNRDSACQLCLLLNQVDGLARDCDLFDDGNSANGSCGSECGDGILQGNEACDDGNNVPNDGCSPDCTVDGGYTCTGQPSHCTLNCGNGVLDAGEECDDGNTNNGDGCNSSCFVESGYSCSGTPSHCTHTCGNGQLDGSEQCDDGNTNNGDGCSNTCHVEPGYNCSGSPSTCTFVCGNGTFQNGETCDDGNTANGDGCSGVCQIEPGWLCFGQPSTCMPICGDGLQRGGETCDDGNKNSGDGCSTLCQTEPGFQCSGQPSHCLAVCGDGFIRGFENCDDHNTNSGDGCSGNFCRQEPGYTCSGQPSVCTANCGNGHLDPQESCDDGNTNNGDGCSSTCQTEPGYACGGQPSLCAPTCGNGILDLNEQCDDGNTVSRDGCSSSCKQESGYVCLVPGTACTPFDVVIDSPANGAFTTASSINITGHYTTLLPGQETVTVNGVPAQVLNPVTRTFSHMVPLDPNAIFNPVLVTLTNTLDGDNVRSRIVVIDGQSVANGAYSLHSVALRVNDSGLASVEPLVADLAASGLDLGALLPPGTVLLPSQCFISVITCLGSASVTIASPPPSFSNVTLGLDSIVGAVTADIDIFNLRVDVQINGSGLVPNCGLRLTANSLDLTGNYSLEPRVSDPSFVDVELVTPLNVNFSGFNHTFTSGLCDAPVIGDIINAFLPDIQSAATNGIKNFLDDPDGPGPQQSPIAAAIQSALDGISIAGAVGQGVGLMLDTPFFAITEDDDGITFGSDSRFRVSIGTGPGQCIPPPGAPTLSASYSRSDVFPTFGPNTPVSNQPYGLGIAISTAGFNQLLRGQIECGLMQTSLTTIDLDGPGGQPPLAITSTLLSLLIPQFSQLPPNTPLRIDIAPTLAPIVTGNSGPNGELTELKIAQITMNVVQPGPEIVWLGGVVDADLGMNLSFNGSGLAISLSTPQAGDVTITIVDNPLGANEAAVETTLPALVTPLIPQLAGALSGFPLPEFFGLDLQGVEVSKSGQFLGLYANLVPAP